MSTLFDKDRPAVQPPDERTDVEELSPNDPAQPHRPLVARSDGAHGSDADDTSLGQQLLAAIQQFMATRVAPDAHVAGALSPRTPDAVAASPFDAEAADANNPRGVDHAFVRVARGDGAQESAPETTSRECPLVEAIEHVKAAHAAPAEPVIVAPGPPMTHVLPASPFNLEAVMFAVERATTEEDVMAAVMAFAEATVAKVKAAPEPVAALTAMFGSESVATVAGVCMAAVADLEAEAAATGAPVTEQAGIRIARSMVDRVTLRAGRGMASAPRARVVPRVRTQRAPRARRAPRRAVRLSAVASAGDGPPPEPPAPSRARERVPNSPARRRIARAFTSYVADARAASRAAPESVLPRGVRPFHAALPDHQPPSWFGAIRPLVAIGRMRRAQRQALRPAAGCRAAVAELHDATQMISDNYFCRLATTRFAGPSAMRTACATVRG
jgi:hypothetical protein